MVNLCFDFRVFQVPRIHNNLASTFCPSCKLELSENWKVIGDIVITFDSVVGTNDRCSRGFKEVDSI